LISALRDPAAYPHAVSGAVELIETHISWVLLAGEFAYKIKKPIQNHFLDYSTLELRKECCDKELRLNRRFASELYLDVVGIGEREGGLCVGDGEGEPLEFAVKMKRFPADGLLKDRLNSGHVHLAEVRQLAARIAKFHDEAAWVEATSRFGSLEVLLAEAMDNCHDLLMAAQPMRQGRGQLWSYCSIGRSGNSKRTARHSSNAS
jgi:uncharacterized protein